jgi:hypothetical protein
MRTAGGFHFLTGPARRALDPSRHLRQRLRGYRSRSMRRTACAVTCAALVALGAPAGSSAGVLDVYDELAARQLRPAPLVPIGVPRTVAPLDRTITSSGSRRKNGYGLRIVHYGPNGPNAIIVLEGGSFKTVKAALRDGRRLGFTARRTRVRGHRGHLLTRHVGRTQWLLLWVEDRRVYTLATGTPRKVPLKKLRATAARLESLGHGYIGTTSDPDSSAEAFAVTTAKTVTARVTWEARCVASDGSDAGIRAGNAAVTLLGRGASTFAFDIAEHRDGSDPWNGSVSGVISPASIRLTVRASGTIDGYACDSGPLSYVLDPTS